MHSTEDCDLNITGLSVIFSIAKDYQGTLKAQIPPLSW